MSSLSPSRVLLTRGGAMLGLMGAVLMATTAVVAVDGPPPQPWHHVAQAKAPPGTSGVSAETRIPANRIWKKIVVLENFTGKVKLINVDGQRNDLGDYIVFRDRLSQPRTQRRMGTIDAQCVFGYGVDLCRGTVFLTGRGQIIFEGRSVSGAEHGNLAIVGGTGEFVGVGGELRIDFPGLDFARLTLTLTR
jgi:hypothetical protein